MLFRSIIAEPEQIALLKASFERAWRLIEARGGAFDPSRIPGQRQRLAYIVMGLWRLDADANIVAPAVAQFFAASNSLAAPEPASSRDRVLAA
ncbi:hypothetical protein [Bosea vaviloviae]|uniref:Uncharacterized protein n=1 Tax=Bosea vaviloviae TaxID=1526658 RepID=A0A1D7TWS6_9HYPH|nr:hypothetical protein [Bosea vaviloviae]AOO79556.1 hypothetical protein BHK69_02810 [Bosea vaviloviae]